MSYDFIIKYTDILVEKVREAFAMQKLLNIAKASQFFFNKNISVIDNNRFKF